MSEPTINDDGGPAFPVNTENAGHEGACYPSYGMTLRDYFAAKAMQAIYTRLGGSPVDWDESSLLHSAQGSYAMADATLKARGGL